MLFPCKVSRRDLLKPPFHEEAAGEGPVLLGTQHPELASEVEGVRAGCVATVGLRSEQRRTELTYGLAETKLEQEARGALGERICERLRAHGITIDPPAYRAGTSSLHVDSQSFLTLSQGT